MSKRTRTADLQRRAYSTFIVKKADGAKRLIEGVATTPTPDRLGDVVEPKGSTFKLPMPLLWQHDPTRPVGHVIEAKVSDEGIAFKAQLAICEEPGTLKDRCDEAWQSIVKGLVRGVSIGFSSKEPPELMRNGGLRFLTWDWYELSLVTIPANAEASIATIKSLDRERQRAASGPSRTALIVKTTPAVAGASKLPKGQKGQPMLKNTAAKIREIEDEIDKHKARMAKILEEADDEERELDEDEEKEFDEEEEKALALQKKVHRLKAVNGNAGDGDLPARRGAVREVKADDGSSTARASASRGGDRAAAEAKPHHEKGLGFARLVQCFAMAKGNHMQAAEIAKQRYSADNPVTKSLGLIAKAQVAGGTTFDPTWAGPLVEEQNLVSEFVEFLRPQTIIGKFGTGNIPALRRVPFNIKVPVQISGGAAAWVKEGKAKPLTKMDFNQLLLRFNKVAAIAVLTEELVRHSTPSAEMLVRDELARAVIERLDSDIVNPSISAVAETNPAALNNGAQTYVSFGITADMVRADIRRLVSFFIANNIPTGGLVLIMREAQALSLSLMRNAMGVKEFPEMTINGGSLEGIPVIASQYVTQGVVTAVCAPEVYLADDGGVAVDMSREASLEMATDPSMASSDGASPPAPAETTLVSMFQTNSVAIRAERVITWKLRRAAACAYQTSTGWGNLDTSPPQASI